MKIFWLFAIIFTQHLLSFQGSFVGARLFNVEEYPKIKICNGDTEGELVSYHNPDDAYKRFRADFGNCTHIIGNLIMVDLKEAGVDGKAYDYSFLESIVEVNGYVYITGNTMKRIPLTNLRVIRGLMTFNSNSKPRHALYIGYNQESKINGSRNPLAEIDLRNLQSILHNNVSIDSNLGLCYIPGTINWAYILKDPKKQGSKIQGKHFNKEFCKAGVSCHKSCPLIDGKRYCWGPRPEQCQKITQCDGSLCGSRPCFLRTHQSSSGENVTFSACCDEQCTAGCTGPTSSNCLACRNYLNGKKCVRECPKATIYDKTTYMDIANPNPRYTFGSLCVKKCPRMAIRGENSYCYTSCNLKTHFLKNGDECIKCPGNRCRDHYCIIEDMLKELKLPQKIKRQTFTPRSLLKKLKKCKHVLGNIRIFNVDYIFKKAKYRAYKDEKVRPQDLENLRNLRTVIGSLYFDFVSPEMQSVKNLSFLSNLETLRSSRNGFQLSQSNVEFLGFRSLKHVSVEKFILAMNPKLCYLENMRKRFLFAGQYSPYMNSPESKCRRENHVCHPQCDSAERGCWGPGDGQCIACLNYRIGHRCVPNCSAQPGYFTPNQTANATRQGSQRLVCQPCHKLCSDSCTGAGPDACLGPCRFARLNNTCVARCPNNMYKNFRNECLPCSPDCFVGTGDKNSCTGPANKLGKGGCSQCTAVVVASSKLSRIQRCWRGDKLAGHYSRVYRELPGAKKVIKDAALPTGLIAFVPCDKRCVECNGDGPRDCRCRYFREKEDCVFNCSVNTYKVENTTSELVCRECHSSCVGGCTGPLNSDCKDCLNVKIYSDTDKDKFHCAVSCPKDLPYASSSICTKEPVTARVKGIIGSSTAVFVVVCILISALCIYCQRRRALAKKNRELATARYRRQLQEEMIPLKETDKQPNNQLLHLIGADQLKKGLEIGSGAFGTVFVGIWRPPKEKSTDEQVEIKVAIKTLKDGGSDGQSANLTNEFLSEAHVMATVDHPFCISLLGVCMTSQIQLISDYMPLGSLVDYLPKHRQELGSQQLLTWAVQIAKGMVYLESLGIIHRDLAARNVLLESLQQVRITDFGLAKLMDEDVEFFAEGGRFPVKWLALECLRRRIFSHKSDVWAFGVTLWEVFTFGSRPYPDVRATELIDYLDRGERLLQPDICTLDIYMLMIKCWLADPEGRPTFEELVTDLSKMAADPARYLVVSSDGTLRVGTNRSNSAVSNTSIGRHLSPHFPRSSRSGTPDSGGRGALAPLASAISNGASPSVSSNDDSMSRKPPVRVAIPQAGLSHLADEVARRNAENRARRTDSSDLRYAALPSTSDENDVFEDYLTPTESAADYLIPNQRPLADYLDSTPQTKPQTVEYYNEVGPSDSSMPAYVNAPHLNGVLAPDGDYLNPQILTSRQSPEYRMAGPIHDYCNTGPNALTEAEEEEDPDEQDDYLLPRKMNGVANPHYTGVPLKKDKSPSRYLPLVGKRSSPPKEMV